MVFYKSFSYRGFSEKATFALPLLLLFSVCCFFGSLMS